MYINFSPQRITCFWLWVVIRFSVAIFFSCTMSLFLIFIFTQLALVIRGDQMLVMLVSRTACSLRGAPIGHGEWFLFNVVYLRSTGSTNQDIAVLSVYLFAVNFIIRWKSKYANFFFFIKSPRNAAICPRTFSSSVVGIANGMQGIHPVMYHLWVFNQDPADR